jgi:carboxymethylenebutenolidase
MASRYLVSALVVISLIHFLSGHVAANTPVSYVQYQSGQDSVVAYLVLPEGKEPFPAVILIHEWWDLNDWMMQNADTLAARGYGGTGS